MGLFSALTNIAIDVVRLPLDVAHDIISLGGAIDNDGRPHTLDRLNEIKRDAEKADE